MPALFATKIDPEQLNEFELQYVYEEKPGIRRVKRGRGFSFLGPDGSLIRDKTERRRLLSVAVPPTYEDVWYCPLMNGHLQATGRDSTSKKQYFYHPQWERLREASKFSAMREFGQALPRFRRAIAVNLRGEESSKRSIIAAMARILDRTGMRVGNDDATISNKTYGLTTLKKEHVERDGSVIHLEYKGKGGVELEKTLHDPKVSAILEECAEISGQRLFEYHDEDGVKHSIDSGDMNAFLKNIMGQKFSAKDFRTWRFSCLFIEETLRQRDLDAVTLTSVLKAVAERTGNTPATLKSSYIHPGLLDIVREKSWGLLNSLEAETRGLRKHEALLLAYLETDHASHALSVE